MSSAGTPVSGEDPFAYLAVDRYLDSVVSARALKTAFEIGLIDHLASRPGMPVEELARATCADAKGLGLLLGLLEPAGVVRRLLGDVMLAPGFIDILRYRDLLETRLDFAGLLLDDFADHFTALVRDPQRFVREGRLFELFDYRRALHPSPENHARTRAWMRLTTVLTRYEAGACDSVHDFSRFRRLLDVGGNSGEFAARLCARHAGLQATVFDLPVVCEVGLEHLLASTVRDRVAFLPGDLRTDPLPAGHDLIVFKSMLHDWPSEDAVRFIEAAASAVQPGGQVMVFERGPIDAARLDPGFGALPVLLFFRSYRAPDLYVDAMRGAGLVSVEAGSLALDTPFFIVTGRKPV